MPIVLTDLRNVASFVPRLARIIVITALAVTATPYGAAEARGGYNPPHSAIVMDANSGRILYRSHANAHRYPASLTKMMTLYMLFDAMKAGKVKESTEIPVSAYAASKPPTKLGLRPGQTLRVETAIYAMVTKSANDAATAMGEYLGGGSEARFARLMTAKAHQLGMRNTHFVNASGLPDRRQVTTAHDMALLGIALQEHFPKYFHYFSTRYYEYHGRRMRNHNHLLGRIKGVDGIKTGFTNASGFNLVASVANGKRRIIAVVMGGRSSRSRDAQVASLIRKYLPRASTRDRGPLLAARTSAGIPLPGRVALPPVDETPVPKLRAADVLAYAPQDVAVPAAEPKAPVPAAIPANVDPVTTAASRPDGWAIQIGSMPSEAEARSILAKASAKAGPILASASPFTETFRKGSTVYHRARFAGFASKQAAWNACSALKKKDFGCFAVSP